MALAGASAALLLLATSCGGGDGDEASVNISSPEDGATVESPVAVAAEVEDFTLERVAGVREGAGHLHVMVDTACIGSGRQIPADESHRHLADGAAETEIALPTGEHTLCVQAGDGRHTALDLSDEVTITVVGPDRTTTEEQAASKKGAEGHWDGKYKGSVVWDCGPLGRRRGTLEADLVIFVFKGGRAEMIGNHTVTGSCAGSSTGSLTTFIRVIGQRTASGFRFPSTSKLWGPRGSVILTVASNRARGRLRGPAPGPATIDLTFDLTCNPEGQTC